MPDDISRRSFLAGAGAVAAATGLSACGTAPARHPAARSRCGPRSRKFSKSSTSKSSTSIPGTRPHPGTPLDITVKPSNTLVQLQQTAVGAGAGPDILAENGSSTVIPLAQAKQILPLDQYASQYGWDKLLLPWSFDASTWQGKLWSVPNAYETMLMYYNPATFDQHGWKPPTDLQETEALFTEAHGRGIQPITAGNAGFRAATEWFVTMFWNHYSGPDALHQALTGQIKWTDPVFVEPLQILQRWFSNGWIGGSSQDYFTTQFATCYKNLVTGKGLTYWSGTWEFANLPLYFGKAGQNNATWTWANLPQMRPEIPKVVNELSIGGTYSINAKAKDPDGVAKFLGWYLANKKAAVIGLKQFGNEPPPIPLSARTGFRAPTRTSPGL